MPISAYAANRIQGFKILELQLPSGEGFKVQYSRDKYTPKLERKMRSMMDDNMPANSLAKYVVGLVKDWDLFYYVDANGLPTPDHIALGTEAPQIEEANFSIDDDLPEGTDSLEDVVEQTVVNKADKKKAKELAEPEEKEAEEPAPNLLAKLETWESDGDDFELSFASEEVPEYVGPFTRRKIPFNATNLGSFGISFIALIIEGIAKDQRPNQKPSNSSSDTF